MKVRDLTLDPVVEAEPEEAVADAADRMRFYEVGSLAVVDDGVLVGIITERDLARSVAERADPARYAVRAYMTPEPVTIDIDADVVEAGQLMLSVGVRHLPVMAGTHLAGMVSARDLLTIEIDKEVADLAHAS